MSMKRRLMHIIECYLDGKQVYEHECDYLVKAYIQWMWSNLNNSSSKTVKDVAGVNQASPWTWGGWAQRVNAGKGTDGYGIVIGTGNTAVTINDYQLATKIAEGTGVGQMLHYELFFMWYTPTTTEAKWKITRSFVNKSGSPINVAEAGVYVNNENSSYTYLFARDVFGGAISVGNDQNFTVEYTVKVAI